MENTTQLSVKVFEYRYHEVFKRSYCTKAWAREIASHMVQYYNYLKNVLKNCEKVTVTIDTNNAMFVKYSNGGSKIMLDVIYIELLLPEIELLLKQHRKKIEYKQPLKTAA
jgi:hypothetical protein